jgi:tetratricopeptide (TPR) repeat protein
MKAYTIKKTCRAVVGTLMLVLFPVAIARSQAEVGLAAEHFKKMDVFEISNLGTADKNFAAGKYRMSVADYEAFLTKYPKSLAVPYALLRKGRSLQLDNKRFEAIKVYTDLLDYYPNEMDCAGTALYFIGDCHSQNGQLAAALKAWSEMAKDVDYRKHVLAAKAINRLADNLRLQDKWGEALEYYEQVAKDFRNSNYEAVAHAIKQLQYYHVRLKPDFEKLRKLYDALNGFERGTLTPNETNFCYRVIALVGDRDLSGFAEADVKGKKAYYRYWASKLEGRFLTDDNYQWTLAGYRLAEEGDVNAWYGRIDQQYAKYQKADDYDRTMNYVQLYGGHPAKIQEYYARLERGRMSKQQVFRLIGLLYKFGQPEVGRSAIGKLPTDTTDADLVGLVKVVGKDRLGAELICEKINDLELGNLTLLRFFSGNIPVKGPVMDKAMRLGEMFCKHPTYAKEAYTYMATFHESLGEWDNAIGCWRLVDNPPGTLYSIVKDYMAWGKRGEAVSQLSEIENFFPAESSKACLMIADIYSGDRPLYIATLRNLIKKYPGSGESSTAHQRLQAMKVKMGGGEDAK